MYNYGDRIYCLVKVIIMGVKMSIIPETGSRQKAILAEYQDMAKGYDTGSEECGWSAPDILVETLEKMGKIKPDMAVVDFAAGTGALTEAFRNSTTGQSLHIIATDLSPAMLEECREKNVADKLVQQDITKPWSVPENSKDIVAATGVAEYLTDSELAEVCSEAAKTLKSGGVLALTFLPVSEGAELSKQQEHRVSYVHNLFKENGIALQSSEEFDAYRSDDGNTVRHVLVVGVKSGPSLI